MRVIHSTHASPVIVRGVISYGFTTNGEWPNEYGDKPDDFVGRECRVDDQRYKVISCEQIGPGIHHFACEPLKL